MSKMPSEPEEKTATADLEDEDEMFKSREHEREARIGVTDFVRRAIENTVGSAKNTSTLSREAITYLLQQGDRGRKEVLRIVANEVGDFLRHVDLSTEIIKVLTNIQMDFNASIRFRQVEEGKVTPEFSKQSGMSVSVPEDALDPADGRDDEQGSE